MTIIFTFTIMFHKRKGNTCSGEDSYLLEFVAVIDVKKGETLKYHYPRSVASRDETFNKININIITTEIKIYQGYVVISIFTCADRLSIG